jgi:transcriptional regulator with XRE-family HTH domain
MAAQRGERAIKPWNERFRDRRRALDRSQEFIAERAKITQQAISRFEHGAVVPRISTLERLAFALDTTREELFPMEAAPRSKAS